MTFVLGDNISRFSQTLIRKLAFSIACDLIADHYDGEAPAELFEHYKAEATASIYLALRQSGVPELEQWRGEQAVT
jgi:hypothetical protein